MRLLATTAAFLALAGWCAAADDPKDALKKLEGTYEVVDILVAGKSDAKKNEVTAVVIKDGELVMKGKKDDPAKIVVDPSKTPPHIDLTAGPELKFPGVYELKETDKGTELTLAFRVGAKAERPKDFKGEGKDEVLIKLFRKKAK